jgi:hypothetical protein
VKLFWYGPSDWALTRWTRDPLWIDLGFVVIAKKYKWS